MQSATMKFFTMGAQGMLRQPQPHVALQQVRTMATKKAGGSTANGRDSAGRRLGIKVWPTTFAKAGAIILRQRGQKFRPGDNVGRGKDDTLFAKVAGIVKMTRAPTKRKGKRHLVHVIPEGAMM